MRGFVLVAVSSLLAMAGAAFGEFQYASFVAAGTTGSGTAYDDMEGAPDGIQSTVNSGNIAINGGEVTHTVHVRFPNMAAIDNPSFVLYGVTFLRNDPNVTARVEAIQWHNTDGTPLSGYTSSHQVNVFFTAGSTVDVPVLADLTAVNSNGNFENSPPGVLDYLIFAVTFRNNGSNANASGSFAIDAISNPEPSTLALFGLGAAGAGAAVLRKRRARQRRPSA